MLGPIINVLNKAGKFVIDLKNHTEIIDGVSAFGPGNALTPDVTVSEHTKLTDLATQYNGLNFTNLTVSAPLIFDSATYMSGANQVVNFTDTFPLILRCSGTLNITSSGYISANGQGCNGGADWGGTQSYTCPMLLEDVKRDAKGFSLSHDAYGRLLQYGSAGGFLDPTTLICGNKGGHYHYWRTGSWLHYSYHSSEDTALGIISGGDPRMCPTHDSGRRRRIAGSSGGSIFLYFDHLYIDGLEYGKDPLCNISVIQANGAFPVAGYESITKGGGTITIIAKTINITTRAAGSGTTELDTGSIMANGVLDASDIITPQIVQWRWSVLNNLPQLALGQTGWVIQGTDMDEQGVYHTINKTYEPMTTNLLKFRTSTIIEDPQTHERSVVDSYDPDLDQHLYFYDDGLGNYRAINTTTPYNAYIEDTTSHNTWAGGAGVVLGFKL